MSFAIVSARHVMALSFISETLGVGRQVVLEVCDAGKFAFVGDD